jgi:hypothetical protein
MSSADWPRCSHHTCHCMCDAPLAALPIVHRRYFFLQAFFDVGALSVLNFLSIFIILGIGADDIFIFVDAWKQSGLLFPPPAECGNDPQAASEARREHLAERLLWTYQRASWAMLVTSLTTGAAFLMNIISSVIPIQVKTIRGQSGCHLLFSFSCTAHARAHISCTGGQMLGIPRCRLSQCRFTSHR